MKSKKILLDDVNRFIISELLKDGRMKFTTLARKLNVTPAAVKERVDRLIRNKLIRTSALINAQMILPLISIIGIESDSDGINSLVKKLRNCPIVVSMVKTSGTHNLMISTATEGIDQLENFLSNQIRSEPGIRHVEVNIGNSSITPEYHNIRLFYNESSDSVPCGLKSSDRDVCADCPNLKKKESK
jgi:DNA-binding Lrp family transcriptional regulator